MKRKMDGPERLMAADLIRELLGERKDFTGVELVGDAYNLKNHRHFDMLQHYLRSRDFTVLANRIVFSKVNFKALRAESLFLPYIVAKGAIMDKMDISNAVFNNADLRLAGLRQAKLTGIDLSNSIMNGVLLLKSDLTEALLVKVAMTDATLSNAVLVKADLSGAKLSFSKFDHTDMREANLSGATLFQTNFQNANLEGANLEGALLGKTNFKNANLRNTRFAGAKLDRPNFVGANLEDATGINATRTSTTPLEVQPLPDQPSEHDTSKAKSLAETKAQRGRPRQRGIRSNWILTARLSAEAHSAQHEQAATAQPARPPPTPAEIIAALKAAGRLPEDYVLPTELGGKAAGQNAAEQPAAAGPASEPVAAATVETATADQPAPGPEAQAVAGPEPAKAEPEPALEPRVFEHAIRVPIADADPTGMVYYSNYLMYFDMARSAMFRTAGMPYALLLKHGLLMPVVEAQCLYKAPARCDDLINILLWCDDVRGSYIRLAYEIRRDECLLACGHTLHLCVSAQGKVVQPFPELLKLLGR